MSILSILGEELPPSEVVDILVSSYINAMHWYVPLLHEPSFRARLNAIVRENTCSQSDRPFVLLSVCVMLMGLHFATPEGSRQITHILSMDMASLQAKLTSSVERNFLESFDQYNQDWICFACLLSMYYLLNQQPRRASVVMGSAVQAARDMRLDKASVDSLHVATLEAEMQKRVWWTLFAGDGYDL